MIRNISYGTLFFFVFYRLNIVNTGVSFNLILGLSFILVSILKVEHQILVKKKSVFLFIFSFLLFFYSIIIDLLLVKNINEVNSFFSIRLIAMLILTFSSALFFKAFFIRKLEDLIFLFRFAVVAQFLFFLFLFLFPNYKPLVYSLFGASESVNLLEWNMESRGFGVGAELNYTGPILTVIVAFIAFKSIVSKLVVFLSQVANANTTLITLIFLLNKKSIKMLVFLLLTSIVFFNFYEFNLQGILPRFNKELDSGFTTTIFYLISDHFVVLNSSILEYIFGVPINIMPGANNIYSSDSGWIIMLNYGGIVFVLLFVSFLTKLISNLQIKLSFKIYLLIIGLLLNFKGIILGPNAYFFLLFLLSSVGYSESFNKSLENNNIC